MRVFQLFSKERKQSLDQGLEKTKEGLFGRISRAIAGKSVVDEEVLDGLEEALIASDLGLETTVAILSRLEQRVARDKYLNTAELNGLLKQEMISLLGGVGSPPDFEAPLDKKPYVILVVGVNGVGKTTTIGKLAYQYKKAGKSVLMAAGDTFRAAAIDQLTIWSDRVGVPLVKQSMGSDPGAVAFDAIQSGIARNLEVILIDTAGRLHNKAHLMEELSKIRRVMKKILPDAPHEVLLVLDGSTGQNALEQAKQFTAVTEVSALAVTKLDGTAKGGIVLAISAQLKIPVKYIGVGEKMEDLQLFHLGEFVDSLLA
ncbi:MAG TPA: signal recognition particle-docking protein FtsY [Chitinophagaceae bacterium]|nr:signal recognition particle-docking protein FtsY [Chitinophagaceae bacterium]